MDGPQPPSKRTLEPRRVLTPLAALGWLSCFEADLPLNQPLFQLCLWFWHLEIRVSFWNQLCVQRPTNLLTPTIFHLKEFCFLVSKMGIMMLT